MLVAGGHSAVAQYYYYPPYSAYPSPRDYRGDQQRWGYGGPSQDDYDYEPSRRPRGDTDTLFRIHGTNEPDTIRQAVSSGRIRMLNAEMIDLYRRVRKGARVVVR
jgi:lipoprotein-anchoring transpeptidase ErfK/SrfK